MSIHAPAVRRTHAGAAGDVLFAAALVLAATALGFLLSEVLSVTSQAMLYVLALVVIAYRTSRAVAVASSLAAVMALNYLFIPPRFTLGVDDDENVTALLVMLVVSLIVSRLVAALQREAQVAHVSEARAQALQQLATDLGDAASIDTIAAVGQRFLARAFGEDCRLALLDEAGEVKLPQPAQPQVRDALAACMRRAAAQGSRADGAPGLRGWCLPLRSEQNVEGAAYVSRPAGDPVRALDHAEVICSLVGQALWRQKLAASVRVAEESARWHRAQSTFLAGISHDVRTPLAALVTAASSLHTQREKLSAAEQQRLTQVMLDEAAQLAKLTENTLHLASLQNGGQVRRDWQSMEEIVGAVLGRVRQRDPQRRISAKVPPDLPLLRADPVLLAQLLDNLLDNALRYTEGAIELIVGADAQSMEVTVQDRGDGIAPEREESIFEPYRRSDRSGRRGAGLGLAVCRAIAQAHGGGITLRRREGGGCVFTVRLPVDAVQPATEDA